MTTRITHEKALSIINEHFKCSDMRYANHRHEQRDIVDQIEQATKDALDKHLNKAIHKEVMDMMAYVLSDLLSFNIDEKRNGEPLCLTMDVGDLDHQDMYSQKIDLVHVIGNGADFVELSYLNTNNRPTADKAVEKYFEDVGLYLTRCVEVAKANYRPIDD